MDKIIKEQFVIMKLLPLILIIVFASDSFAAQCVQDGTFGSWKQASDCSPGAWDGVFVPTNINGDKKYIVDWCGWRSNESQECASNCRGGCSSYGTTFPDTSGVQGCRPESAKIYQWVCNDCADQYAKLAGKCGDLNIALFDNTTCTGACGPKSLGPQSCPAQ